MPWGSSWERGDNKKKCKRTAQWSAGLRGNSVWNKHPAEFQVSMIQRIFVYGNPERLISLLRTRSVWWCGVILSYKYLPVQILGSITCYYSLKGDILTGSGAGWGSFIENIWNISSKIYRWSPLLSCFRPFYFDLINHVFIYLTRVNSTRRKIWK